MKEFAQFEKEIGGDGAKLHGTIGVNQTDLVVELSATYPVEKIIAPATKALDGLLDKLEQLIPGNWDKPLIESVKKEYKEELLKLLTENQEPKILAETPAQV